MKIISFFINGLRNRAKKTRIFAAIGGTFLLAASISVLLAQTVFSPYEADSMESQLAQNADCILRSDYIDGEVLVKFKPGVDMSSVDHLVDSLSLQVERHFPAISRVKGQPYALVKSYRETTQQVMADLAGLPEVEQVSPNYRVYADSTVPNDPRFSELWGLHNTGQTGGTADIDIDAPEAWVKTSGSSEVIVAVIDSGIDYHHPDLTANLWVNPYETQDGVDNDGNGYIDDIHGINAITLSGDPMDDNGHGTHCSGTIGAVGNNGQGVAGVNWNVRVMGTKFLNSSGSGSNANAITCIDYIIEEKTTYGQDIVVINASWGGGSFDQNLKDAIDAAGEVGIVFCAAAGNNGTNNDTSPHYPSSYTSPNIIAVTAVDHNGTRYYNYGLTSVDLAAPGVSILSTGRCTYSPQPGDPFYDNMEAGGSLWSHGGSLDSWGITNAASGGLENYWTDKSYGNFWSDSPGSGYVHNVNSWLATANNINLSPYIGQTVYLCFDGGFQFDYFASNDTAAVEVSKDGGASWNTLVNLGSLYYGNGYYYLKQSYVIPDLYKTANFRFRFHITTDASDYSYYGYKNRGWIIDNIGIGSNLSCGYAYMNGTSMATPHVTGAVAFIAGYYPEETAAERITRILSHVVPLSSLSGQCVTGGLLNLDLALEVLPPTLTLTSPNGGENWGVGTIHEISWSAPGSVGDVKLEYSVNNGKSWIEIVSSTANDGAFSWTIPDNPSENCRVRVSEIGGTLSDTGDAVFSITVLPTITITSPNGGEHLEVGSTHEITWTSTGNVGNVTIQYYTGGPTTLTTIIFSTPNDGKYTWVVPPYPKDTYLLKISEIDGSPSDTSDRMFKVSLPSSITVTSPNGGEQWSVDTTQNITWQSRGTSGNVKIDYSTDKGNSWLSIVESAPDTGIYRWVIPNTPSANCLVRVSDAAGLPGSPGDVGNSVFTIFLSPGILVTSPNGGEKWKVGSVHNITWISRGTSGNVNIDYSTDTGGSWIRVASNLQDNGIYSWTIPNTPSSFCRVRVSDSNDLFSDVGDAVFSIDSKNCIVVTSPNGGEKWPVNSTQTVSWITDGTVSNVKIESSIDNGGTWRTIAASTPNTGSFSWIIPGSPSDRCFLRISEVGGTASDVSNSGFSIVNPPALTVVFPNGGEVLSVGTSQPITWTSAGAVGDIKIQFSSDSGTTWSDITTSTANDGSFTWTVPNTPSTACLVRISEIDDSPSDVGNTVFTITEPTQRTITITSPNGGENLDAGSSHEITWTSSGDFDSLVIQYSGDGGASWKTIAASTENDGSFQWTVPVIHSPNCLVRIAEKNKDNPSDISDGVFSVTSPTITVVSPNGGENFIAGSVQSITWTTTGSVGNVTIAYSVDGGKSWSIIAEDVENVDNSGSFSWTVPNQPSGNCLVQIKANNNDESPKDTGDGTFSILPPAGPAITVLHPNGGETFFAGDQVEITWTGSQSIANVEIAYSPDNGLTWTGIITSTPNDGTFQWTTPQISSDQVLIRVRDTGGEPSDTNDGVFSILLPTSLTLTSPNGGETLYAGTSHEIAWTWTGSIVKVDLEYSPDGGKTWNRIAAAVDNDGSYDWTVPGTPSQHCLVRVSEGKSDTQAWDVSNSEFTIDASSYSSIAVVSPNGGETLYAGSSFEITWVSMGITGDVKIQYSYDRGATWEGVVESTANDGSYTWIVPGTASAVCLVQVSGTGGNSIPVSDESDAVFEISTGTKPTLTVIAPNGGETLYQGSVYEITWAAAGSIDKIAIDYSTDGGLTWKNIAAAAAVDGRYQWTVPGTTASVTENGLVRIRSMEGDLGPRDVSDAVFSIVKPEVPTLTVTSPNGGERLMVDTTHEITWTDTGEVETVMIEYSIDRGSTWVMLTESTPNQGSYEWEVPGTLSEHCLVRVRGIDSDKGPSDTSDKVFSIVPFLPQITVTYPNGGEIFYADSLKVITWSCSPTVANVMIEYSTDNGAAWSTITGSTPNTGRYEWTVPQNASTQCLVRVTAGGSSGVSDVSDAVFSIVIETYNCGYQGYAWEGNPSGPKIPGVEITFVSEDGSLTKRTTTNSSGFYRISLKPQRYVVTAKHPDFQTYGPIGFFVVTGSNGYQTGNFFLTRK